MKIFINIVSYKDQLLWDTVNDCIINSSDPTKLHFAIVDQSDEPYDIRKHIIHKQISYFHMDSLYSRGPCWARSIAHSFYDSEDYVLQIDSHTVFDKDWDTHLINQLKECQKISEKCIISSYPPEFEFIDDVIVKNTMNDIVTIFRPKPDSSITKEDPSFSFRGYNVKSNKAVKGFHVAGGFIFAPGNFFQQIPYDPSIYFIGEEQNIATRAWTHGWDIYHINYVPLYHLYHTKTSRPLHWDRDDDINRSTRWYLLRERSRKRLMELLLEQKDLGVYSLGKIRSLNEFAEFSGIDYINKKITILKLDIQ